VVRDKKKGKTIKAPEEPKQPKPAPDLMEALEETLARMSDGKGKRKGMSSKRKAAAAR